MNTIQTTYISAIKLEIARQYRSTVAFAKAYSEAIGQNHARQKVDRILKNNSEFKPSTYIRYADFLGISIDCFTLKGSEK